MVTLIKALQVILALSILIFIHELGHFFWARVFGIKVDKFYLFFDIGGKSIAHWKWGDTEFGIGWLPLGGYCKISGMIDESMDLGQMKSEPQPWEYRTHPAWQRAIVTAGGVVNNFIFAILCYIGIMAGWGNAYIANSGTKIYASELAEEMGFRTGDEIISLDDYVPEDFSMLQADIARRNVSKARVLRASDTVDIYIDRAMISEVLDAPLMFDVALPFIVDSVASGNPNEGTLVHGDRVIAFGDHEVEYLQDSRQVLSGMKDSTVSATVLRGADTLALDVKVDTAGRVGIYMMMPDIRESHYTLGQAIPAGLRLTWDTIRGYLQDLRLLATPSTGAYKSVGSFIAIGQVFPAKWDWYRFLNILALLSIMLGVMNLLPIPGLDGGHILINLFEVFTGRKPSDRFLITAQIIGMVILIMLMMLAFGNDIGRLIR
ncbi:MAG: RIP metalloprotease RseP [Bacteroidales bacterium]|nr:RIP metalloprotease RseP [Bacteroidales bacterium]